MRSDPVAVRAYQFALFNFEQSQIKASVSTKICDGFVLRFKVVPVHCDRMEDPTAILAGLTFLEFIQCLFDL